MPLALAMARRHRRSTPSQGVWEQRLDESQRGSWPDVCSPPAWASPQCQGREGRWVRTAGSARQHLQPGSLAAQAEPAIVSVNTEGDNRCSRLAAAPGKGTPLGCSRLPRAAKPPGMCESLSSARKAPRGRGAEPTVKGRNRPRSPGRGTETRAPAAAVTVLGVLGRRRAGDALGSERGSGEAGPAQALPLPSHRRGSPAGPWREFAGGSPRCEIKSGG